MNSKLLALTLMLGMAAVPGMYADTGDCATTQLAAANAQSVATSSSDTNVVSSNPNNDHAEAPQNWVEYGGGG